ncbi:hypothetical protein [Nocardioides nematodiphilus]|uniref:hypothetical protein n=1 Tax=Nocardioides nematodiphilus TaxID=2849669 RepID=UPI001CDA3AD5|nr:hypothetical protein [Nocardioides nematodiphilus]MCA1982196.1 hypothetical protein [Nocardioides nematodiphilus]
MTDSPDEKRMRLRYAGACRLCGAPRSAGTPAVYERSTRTVRCIGCSPAAADSGVTDGSVTPPS